MMRRRVPPVLFLTAILGLVNSAAAQYPGWQHSGSMFILTTPEGANLPAGTAVSDFPLLVRLDKEFFDFSQAKADGADIRFSGSDGKPLAYQIEQWDPAKSAAAIWVRIPRIQGNARQEIKLHWGKPDATSESNGAAVFNASNGYLSVWHMGDPVRDEVGTLESKDTGTKPSGGVIGAARAFSPGHGVACGEQITSYPMGSSPHTSEAWIRPERVNSNVLAWGNEHGQGKVVMNYRSPPHIRMECYFSAADVAGRSTVPAGQWVHVVHTYQKGDSRVYVNGQLDGVTTGQHAPLAIRRPARLYLGGWYNHYNFAGDIDEVRISNVTRSPEWVKLQYENQKPLQTLVGPLVQPGATLAVSPAQSTIPEGQTAAVSAQAGGAQKLYWVLKRDGREEVVAVDRFHVTIPAGRVTGDQSAVLQLKAVYPDGVKTRDIPVTIKEAIPEPIVTLKAPAQWDGRQAIEIVPQIANLAAMQAKGAGEVHQTWTLVGPAVIKEVTPAKLILKRAQNSGPLAVTLSLDNGGQPAVATAVVFVSEPKHDPWIERTPEADEKPEDGQFYARNDNNEGTLHYNGKLDEPADSVFLKVYADNQPYKTETRKPGADGRYAFAVKLKPGLVKYRVEFGASRGGQEKVLHAVENLVCGDAYLIDGQSNALATDTGEKSPPETNEWVRSYAGPPGHGQPRDGKLWCYPVWKTDRHETAELGWWGMELAKRLVASQKVPIFIVNGAVGGTRIDQHQRNDANPADTGTIYGRMLWRVQRARLTHGIRGILWHQGESDQGADGPTGRYGWETYRQFFLDMAAGWKQDYPNVRHYYTFQIWPHACSMGSNGSDNMLREVQRTLPQSFSNMRIMSTLGIKPPGGCHYPLTGWAEFARLVQPQIERDNYGAKFTAPIDPPNLKRAYYIGAKKDEIALEFDQPVVWSGSLAKEFYLDGQKGQVATGRVSGNTLTLTLKEPSTAAKITYLDSRWWSPDNLLLGANGIAALTFCEVPIGSAPAGLAPAERRIGH